MQKLRQGLILLFSCGLAFGVMTEIAAATQNAPYEIHGDFGLGLADLSAQPDAEANKKGNVFELGISAVRNFSQTSLEAGLGYMSTQLRGDNNTYTNQSYRLQSPFLKVGLWWRVDPAWYLGISTRLIAGVESDFGPKESARKTNVLASAQVLYRLHEWAPNWTVGMQMQHDLTIKDRNYRAGLIHAGYFFDVPRPSTSAAPRPKVVKATPSGSLVLWVESEAGVPLKNVQFEIRTSDRSVRQDVIKSGGRKEFKSFPKGLYEIAVAAEGYREERKKFVVGDNQISKVRIRLISQSEFEVEQSFDLGVINFEFAKTTLTPDSLVNLDKVVTVLQENPGLRKLAIAGHTDNVGSRSSNMVLSQGRAKAVADYLISKGIDHGRLEYRGYGPDVPVADNQTDAGRAQNRRVEFIVKDLQDN